ncbi:MAG: DUF4266 domain-containing protein [Myxococcales bacterium]|nr:DUF4266 domain-containing protein [Myxococcales bacterium]
MPPRSRLRRAIERALPCTALFIVLLTQAACSHVPAYSRAWIAKPAMQADPNPQATELEHHVFEYREGSTGGTSTVGGGCGCN